MSFSDFEGSRNRGTPAEIYMFRYGSAPGAFFAYTDAEEPITFQGVQYQPVPIERDKFKSSGSLDKSALKIRMPKSLGLAGLFSVYPPARPITLHIRQGHLNDPDADYKVAWAGRVIQCERNGSEAELMCEPISTSMRRPGLRRNYQLGCPHVLYGSECRASKQAATRVTSVLAVNGIRVTLPDGWSSEHPPQKYIGGMLEWEGTAGPEARTILRLDETQNVLTLSGPARDLSPGLNASVVLGCNHRYAFTSEGKMDPGQTDCAGLHANIKNFGGQPWIPLKNPINTDVFN